MHMRAGSVLTTRAQAAPPVLNLDAVVFGVFLHEIVGIGGQFLGVGLGEIAGAGDGVEPLEADVLEQGGDWPGSVPRQYS